MRPPCVKATGKFVCHPCVHSSPQDLPGGRRAGARGGCGAPTGTRCYRRAQSKSDFRRCRRSRAVRPPTCGDRDGFGARRHLQRPSHSPRATSTPCSGGTPGYLRWQRLGRTRLRMRMVLLVLLVLQLPRQLQVAEHGGGVLALLQGQGHHVILAVRGAQMGGGGQHGESKPWRSRDGTQVFPTACPLPGPLGSAAAGGPGGPRRLPPCPGSG